MSNRLSFGIGCFHFGIKKTPPFEFKCAEHISEVRKALEFISNIDNISVCCDEDSKNWSTEVTDQLPPLNEGGGFFPNPRFMVIEFDVYIPFRVQEELVKKLVSGIALETGTERFRISMRYGYYAPVTIVEPLNVAQENSPSQAIVVVREFLRKELQTSKSRYLRLEVLGPSPFHADCFSESLGEGEHTLPIHVKQLPKLGYDSLVFYYDESAFGEVQDAKENILEEAEDELGFFYKINQIRDVEMKAWGDIEDSIQQLISLHRKKGIKGFFARLVTCSRLARDIFISLAEFDSHRLFSDNYLGEHCRDLYPGQKGGYFRSYIESSLKERAPYPTEQLSQLTNLLESRRTKHVEVLVILLSAMLGASIGALLTILVSM